MNTNTNRYAAVANAICVLLFFGLVAAWPEIFTPESVTVLQGSVAFLLTVILRMFVPGVGREYNPSTP